MCLLNSSKGPRRQICRATTAHPLCIVSQQSPDLFHARRRAPQLYSTQLETRTVCRESSLCQIPLPRDCPRTGVGQLPDLRHRVIGLGLGHGHGPELPLHDAHRRHGAVVLYFESDCTALSLRLAEAPDTKKPETVVRIK